MRLQDDGSLIASLIVDACVLCGSVRMRSRHRLPAGSSATRLPRQTGSGVQEVESSARKWSIPANNSLGGAWGGFGTPNHACFYLLYDRPSCASSLLHTTPPHCFFPPSQRESLAQPNHVIEVLCFSLCLSYLITSTDLDVNVAPCHLFLHCTLVSLSFWMNSWTNLKQCHLRWPCGFF